MFSISDPLQASLGPSPQDACPRSQRGSAHLGAGAPAAFLMFNLENETVAAYGTSFFPRVLRTSGARELCKCSGDRRNPISSETVHQRRKGHRNLLMCSAGRQDTAVRKALNEGSGARTHVQQHT